MKQAILDFYSFSLTLHSNLHFDVRDDYRPLLCEKPRSTNLLVRVAFNQTKEGNLQKGDRALLFIKEPGAGKRFSEIEKYLQGIVIENTKLFNVALLHASGVVHEGKALLFTGPGGFGKTTIAKRLSNGSNLIHDDMIIVHHMGNRVLASACPMWTIPPNTGLFPVSRVFFISKANFNMKVRLSKQKAFRLITMPRFQSSEHSKRIFRKLVDTVPCFRLWHYPFNVKELKHEATS